MVFEKGLGGRAKPNGPTGLIRKSAFRITLAESDSMRWIVQSWHREPLIRLFAITVLPGSLPVTVVCQGRTEFSSRCPLLISTEAMAELSQQEGGEEVL